MPKEEPVSILIDDDEPVDQRIDAQPLRQAFETSVNGQIDIQNKSPIPVSALKDVSITTPRPNGSAPVQSFAIGNDNPQRPSVPGLLAGTGQMPLIDLTLAEIDSNTSRHAPVRIENLEETRNEGLHSTRPAEQPPTSQGGARSKRMRYHSNSRESNNRMDDEDIQVISELPPLAAQRNAAHELSRMKLAKRRADSLAARRQIQDRRAELIDLDLVPEIPYRPEPDRTLPWLVQQERLVQAAQAQASSPQIVNGRPVGHFYEGRYIPAPPSTISSVRNPGGIHPGPHDIYNGQNHPHSHMEGLNGETSSTPGYLRRLIDSFAPGSVASYLNRYTHDNMPGSLATHRSALVDYQTAYQQNQISAEDLHNLLSNIKDVDIPPEQREPNPIGLTKSLMEHQRIGLTWLRSMEASTNRGGILADSMGLGKTIQTIALILADPSKKPECKSTLVVAPVSLLRQWEREIRVMTFPVPSIYIHHGSKKLTSSKQVASFDIVLTSFNTIGYEHAIKARYEEQSNPGAPGPAPARVISDINWYRIVLDEAHSIKNKATRSARGCCDLNAKYRWALTGTPMQNSVDELYSLIRFLKIKPYNDHGMFTRDIARPLGNKDEAMVGNAIKKLQALLTAIMLRRTKESKIDGKAILQLPEKHNLVVEVTMAGDELARYKVLENGAQKALKLTVEHDKGSTGSNMLVLLLRLRQSCDHPLLSGMDDDISITTVSKHEGKRLAETLKPEVVARLKMADATGFECPICFDVMSASIVIIVPCGHSYCGECLLQQLENSQQMEDDGNGASCPECRQYFILKQCISLRHFRSAHGMPRPFKLETAFEQGITPDAISYETESDIKSDAIVDETKLDTKLDPIVDETELHIIKLDAIADETKLDIKTDATDDEIKVDIKTDGPPRSLYSALLDKGKQRLYSPRMSETRLADRFVSRYNLSLHEFEQSAKLQKMLTLLRDIRERHAGEKTIVFSQFTSFLDLVEIPLTRGGFQFLRYDGSMKPEERNEALIQFEDDPAFNVILVSLKAGNVGLNLTCANHVILSEPFWNPYVEDQAVDRAHRIGQQRQVFVHRLIIKDSVESRVLTIQNQKRKLIESAMDPSQAAAITKLGRREIAFLFGITSHV